MTHLLRIRSLLRQPLVLIAVLLIAAVSCAREVTAPSGPRALRVARGISFLTEFPKALRDGSAGSSTLVEFTKVRVVLYRTDGTVALDTMVNFPANADTLKVDLSVPLSPTAPASGEQLDMNLKYVNNSGDTVFKGTAPVTATASTGTTTQTNPSPVVIKVTYTGTGATASKVRIASPRTAAGYTGDAFTFTAAAYDANNAVIDKTPIKWSSLDPNQATITSAGAGVGVMGAQRGTARIVAELLTGPADTVLVSVQPKAKTLAVGAGNSQTGPVNTKLPLPIVAKVTGDDGLGVSGTTVRFQITSGGGNVPSADVVTDANGLAAMDWTLGTSSGTQTVQASATGLAGSPITFTATAAGAAPVAIEPVAQPAANIVAGVSMGTISYRLKDQFGNTSNGFSGPVSIAFAKNPTNATLGGTLTVNAVAGIATFSNLSISKVGSGYQLIASASGLPSTATSGFNITPANAASLAFGVQPTGMSADNAIPSFSVLAYDAFGNQATTFAGSVTLGLSGSTGATLSGTTTATASNGEAKFSAVRLTKAGSGYQIVGTSTGLTATAASTAFAVSAGQPASCSATSGDNQTWFTSAVLPVAPVVTVLDAYSNLVPTSRVDFAAKTGGGSVSVGTVNTNSSGTASTGWTLGSTAGSNSLEAKCGGSSATLTLAATAQTRGMKLNVGNSPSFTDVAVTAGQQIALPIVLDLSYPEGSNLASTSFDIQFDAARFTFVSGAAGSFGSVLENSAAAANGVVTIGIFSPTAATANTTLYTITLQAKAVTTQVTTPVSLRITAAGTDAAVNTILLPRNVNVTVKP